MIRLNDLLYINYDAWMLVGAVAETYSIITSVIFDNVFLNTVSSVANCISTYSSFYVSATELYIHTPTNEDPYNHKVKLGAALQYRKGGNAYINGNFIDDRLASVPDVTKQISDMFDSKLVFSGGTPELNNADGKLDTLLENEKILGNKAVMYDINPETGEWHKFLSGFVQSGNVGISSVPLSLKNDIESLFNIDLPRHTFSDTDYPFIDPKNAGKVISLLFGKIRNLEIICVNDLEPGALNYTFVMADRTVAQMHAVNAVRVDDVAVAHVDLLATNSFTIAAADYTPGDSVTADVEGFEDSTGDLMENACDIIKFLMNTFLLFADTSDFYRVWDTPHAYNIYLVINESRKLIEIIEEACRSSFISIIPEDSGAFSAIVNLKGDYFLKELLNWDIIYFDPTSYNIEKILTSVLVKFNKDYKNDKFYTYKNTNHESELFDLYNIYNNKTVELNLVTELDAINASEQIIDYFNQPWKLCTLKMPYYDAYDLFIGYNYKVNFTRPKAPNIGEFIVKIMTMQKNLNDNSVSLTVLLVKKIVPAIPMTPDLYDDCLYDDALYGGTSTEEALA